MCTSVEDIIQNLEIHVQGDRYIVTGQLHWEMNVVQAEAPHQMGREIDSMGQALKRKVYQAVLEQVDEQIAEQWQLANPQFQKRGRRPYTFITPFGRVAVQRWRLKHAGEGTWQVPSHQVWQTPHRQCIVQGLREATCDRLRNLSVRETRDDLAKEADTEQLLANSTVVKLLHQEGDRLLEAQRQRAEQTLAQHPLAISCGLAPSPRKDAEEPPAERAENAKIELSLPEEQEVWERAVGFRKEPEDSSVCAHKSESEDSSICAQESEPIDADQEVFGPRQADEETVVVQVDEVKTKAQACSAGKENWTYTGYVQVQERRYYVAEASAEQLWHVIAALLCTLGVLSGQRRLLLIADGARWIHNWFAGLRLAGKEMILCWFHLAKKVYEQLSGAGLGKEARAALQREVLHHLWHGELAKALWRLWEAREQARSPQKITELILYLLRRREQLPDYSQRHAAGLMITSNRVEKWNDWAVSDRCKRRGMNWTPEGVLFLAIHESARRNNELAAWRRHRALPAHKGDEQTPYFALAA